MLTAPLIPNRALFRLLRRDDSVPLAERAQTFLTNRLRSYVGASRAQATGTYIEWFDRYLGHYKTCAHSGMHREFGRLVESIVAPGALGIKAVREAPRGNAKSTHLVLGLPLYSLCHRRHKYVLIGSDTQPQAQKHLAAIKHELEQNQLLAQDFPDVCGKLATNRSDALVTSSGARIEALGAKQQIRGRRDVSVRPDLIIVDDPDSEEASYSPAEREHCQSWFFGAVLNAGSPDTTFVVDGTRIHRECLTAVLAKTPGWQHKQYKAVVSWPLDMAAWGAWEQLYSNLAVDAAARESEALALFNSNRNAMLDGFQALWPERYPPYELMKIRATLGHYFFEAEHQNNPIDPTRCEWPPELFPDAQNRADQRWFNQLPPDNADVCTVAMDPSKKNTDKNTDFCAIITLRLFNGEVYVDADLQRRTTDSCYTTFLAIVQAAKPDVSGIESVMFSELFVQRAAQDCARLGLPPTVPLAQHQNKEVRIRKLDPWLRSGALRWRAGSPGVTELLKQLQEFPSGDHDDGPDALEMAFRLLTAVAAGNAQGAPAQETSQMAMP